MRAPLAESVQLSPEDSEPLYRQLYGQIRNLVLTGKLQADTELPPSRQLATALSVGRNTVIAAYDQLIAEGYLTSRQGAGTRVAQLELYAHTDGKRQSRGGPELSQRGKRMSRPFPMRSINGTELPFSLGILPIDAFPRATWQRLLARNARDSALTRFMLQSDSGTGLRQLKQAIVSYLGVSRGVNCREENIFIVGSAQTAFDICARLLADPGDEVWMEEPGYLGARTALLANGMKLVPISVDTDGMVVAEGEARAPHARLAYITPSHQFPTGVTLSLQRRLELLEWATKNDSWIFEDDYDSEYRFKGKPIASVQGLDEAQRVIYLGTFSKTMLPTVKVAYLVVPDRLIPAFQNTFAAIGQIPSPVLQAALADFIAEGHYFSNLKKARAVALERREKVHEILTHECKGLEITLPDGGLTLPVWVDLDEPRFTDACEKANLTIRFADDTYLRKPRRKGLLLGYAGIGGRQLEIAANRLAKLISKFRVA